MRLRNVWVGVLGIAFAASVAACGGSQETSNTSAAPSSPAATPGGQKVDTANAGSVKGTVAFDGTAPTVTLTGGGSGTTNTATYGVTATFSENVTGFVMKEFTPSW